MLTEYIRRICLLHFIINRRKKCGVASIRWINWFKEGNLSIAKAYGLLNKENPSRMKSVLLDFHSTNISKEAREKDLRLKYSLKEVMLTYKLLFCVHNVITITEEKWINFVRESFFSSAIRVSYVKTLASYMAAFKALCELEKWVSFKGTLFYMPIKENQCEFNFVINVV